jgi:hypothetical protein
MSPAKLRRLRRERAARVGLIQFSAKFQEDLMTAIVDDRQRGPRGCSIVVGESSLHAKQQPTLAPKAIEAVTLLTATRAPSADTHRLAPADEATPWRNTSPNGLYAG